MSDVDPGEPTPEEGSGDAVADAINEVQPPGTVLFPESDSLRAALSGVPAGASDEMPDGADAIKAAMDDAADAVEETRQGQLAKS